MINLSKVKMFVETIKNIYEDLKSFCAISIYLLEVFIEDFIRTKRIFGAVSNSL